MESPQAAGFESAPQGVTVERFEQSLPSESAPRFQPTQVPLIREVDLKAEASEARRAWITRWLGRTALVLGLGLLLWVGQKVLERYHQSRIDDLVEAAVRAQRAGDPAMAKQRWLQALSEGASRSRVLSELAAYPASDPVERLRFLGWLVEEGSASEAERLDFCQMALAADQPDLARAEMERLLVSSASALTVRKAMLCVDFLIKSDRHQEGAGWLETLPEGPERRLAEARLLPYRRSKDRAEMEQTAAEVARTLEELLGSATEDTDVELLRAAILEMANGVGAIPMVGGQMDGAALRSALRQVDRLLPAEAAEDVPLRLAKLALKLRLEPAARIRLLDEESAYFASLADADSVLAWAKWLNSQGEAGRVSALFQLRPELAEDHAGFLVKLDSLAGQKRWDEVEMAIVSPDVIPIHEVLARLYLWRCSKEMQEPVRVVQERRRLLLESAVQAPGALAIYAAGYLASEEDLPGAASLYRQRLLDPQVKADALRGLWRTLRHDPGSADEVRHCLQEYARLRPDDVEAQTDLLYSNLLTGYDPVADRAAARELLMKRPADLAVRTVAALGELMAGDVDAAEVAFAGVRVDWHATPHTTRLVRAALLAAAGDVDGGRALASTLESRQLREAERRLLQKHGCLSGSMTPPLIVPD